MRPSEYRGARGAPTTHAVVTGLGAMKPSSGGASRALGTFIWKNTTKRKNPISEIKQ